MFAISGLSPARLEARPLLLAVVAGLACAFVIGKALPVAMSAVSAAVEPLCAASESAGSALDKVEPIALLRLAERAGQARHHGARVLRSRRLHPRASARRFGHRLYHQGRNPLATGRRPGRDVQGRDSRSSSRRTRRISSRPMPATPSPRN